MAIRSVSNMNTPEAPGANIPVNAGSVTVSSGMSPEAVVKYNNEGKALVFDVQGGFPELADSVVRQLSSENRMRYSHAREIHAILRPEAELATQGIQVDLQLVSKPKEKLDATPPKGLVHRWVRPEKLRDRQAKGWKVAGKETKSYLGMTGGMHRVGHNGQDELLLMTKPRTEHEKVYAAKAIKNSARAGFTGSVVTSEAQSAGLSDYNESKDGTNRPWKDIVSTETVGEE